MNELDSKNKIRRYLVDLVEYRHDIGQLTDSLKNINIDYAPKPAVVFRLAHIQQVLEKYLYDTISSIELIKWANLVEMRESLSYEEHEIDAITELLFLLANPEINNRIDKIYIQYLLQDSFKKSNTSYMLR